MLEVHTEVAEFLETAINYTHLIKEDGILVDPPTKNYRRLKELLIFVMDNCFHKSYCRFWRLNPQNFKGHWLFHVAHTADNERSHQDKGQRRNRSSICGPSSIVSEKPGCLPNVVQTDTGCYLRPLDRRWSFNINQAFSTLNSWKNSH